MKSLRVLWVLLPMMAWGQPQPPDTLWSRAYGAIGAMETCVSIAQTADGGYLLAGGVRPQIPQLMQARLRKVDSNGTELWARSYLPSGISSSIFDRVIALADGALLCGGDGLAYLVRTDSNGDTVWTRSVSNNGLTHVARAMVQTSDGNFVVVGDQRTATHFNNGVFVIKFDLVGNTLWVHNYFREPIGSTIEAADLIETPEHGLLVCGTTYGMDNTTDPPRICLIKLDAQGDSLWTQMITLAGGQSRGYAISSAGGGHSLIVGTLQGDTRAMACAVMVDNTGDTLWTVTTPAATEANSVVASPDGNFWIGGANFLGSCMQSVLLSAEPSGYVRWTRASGPSDNDSGIASILKTFDNDLVIGGIAISYEPGFTVQTILVRLSTGMSVLPPQAVRLPDNPEVLSNYPNPFNASTEISFELPKEADLTLKVFDVLGRQVAVLVEGKMAAGRHRITFDGTLLPSGVYFYRMDSNSYSQTKKMLLLK